MHAVPEIGESATIEREVTHADTAAAWGPDFPPAASTPFVLGLAEITCHAAVAPGLESGEITVGLRATIDHVAPTRVGATLRAVARLTATDRGRLDFEVEVTDAGRTVATVAHRRAAVSAARIAERLEQS